jgi:hypothetical protein
MGIYRTVRRLDPETAAYVAGLVDGEGTITLSVEHRGERRRIVVSISNTDRSLLEFVRESVGAGRITGKRTYNERHTPSFVYRVTNRQALDLLSQIASYLKTYRAKRARMALQRYVALTPRNGKYPEAVLRMRDEFEREFLAVGPGPRSPQQSKVR